MRVKKLCTVYGFDQEQDALSAEAALHSAGLPGRLIPLPPSLKAGCGLAWAHEQDAADAEAVAARLNSQGVRIIGPQDVELWF